MFPLHQFTALPGWRDLREELSREKSRGRLDATLLTLWENYLMDGRDEEREEDGPKNLREKRPDL